MQPDLFEMKEYTNRWMCMESVQLFASFLAVAQFYSLATHHSTNGFKHGTRSTASRTSKQNTHAYSLLRPALTDYGSFDADNQYFPLLHVIVHLSLIRDSILTNHLWFIRYCFNFFFVRYLQNNNVIICVTFATDLRKSSTVTGRKNTSNYNYLNFLFDPIIIYHKPFFQVHTYRYIFVKLYLLLLF